MLARVRHAQGRFGEAARLADFVLGRPERALGGEKRAVRLLLAESLLAAGDAAGARAAAAPLYAPAAREDDRLTLADATRLLSLQTAAEAELGLWADVRQNLGAKLAMIELMPPPESARLTAVLAKAAGEGGEAFRDWAEYLSRRVALLGGTA